MQQPQSPTATSQGRHPQRSAGPSAPSTCPRTPQLPMFRSTSGGTTRSNPWAQGHVQWPPPSCCYVGRNKPQVGAQQDLSPSLPGDPSSLRQTPDWKGCFLWIP